MSQKQGNNINSNLKYFSELTDIDPVVFVNDVINIVNENARNCMEALESVVGGVYTEREFVDTALFDIYKGIDQRIKKNFDLFEIFTASRVFEVKKLNTDKYDIGTMLSPLARLKEENANLQLLLDSVFILLYN
jgi:hypothetical protein